MWGIFVYSVLPAGAVMVALLLSGNTSALSIARRALGTPVRISSFQLSIASFTSAICAVLAVCSFIALRGAEERTEKVKNIGFGGENRSQTSSFYWGRNFYMTMLGLVLWLTAWRLKNLAERDQLRPPAAKLVAKTPMVTRILFAVVGVVLLLLADIPLCRIGYNIQLQWYVTPVKEKLLRDVGSCEKSMYNAASPECQQFCEQAKQLSEERLATILSARSRHVFGKVAAEFFDGVRGVEQGTSRIQELFKKKTCQRVVEGVDRSNQLVNASCMLFAVLSIIGGFSCLSTFLDGGAVAVAVEDNKKTK